MKTKSSKQKTNECRRTGCNVKERRRPREEKGEAKKETKIRREANPPPQLGRDISATAERDSNYETNPIFSWVYGLAGLLQTDLSPTTYFSKQ